MRGYIEYSSREAYFQSLNKILYDTAVRSSTSISILDALGYLDEPGSVKPRP